MKEQEDKKINHDNIYFPTIEEFEKAMKDPNFREEYLKRFDEEEEKKEISFSK